MNFKQTITIVIILSILIMLSCSKDYQESPEVDTGILHISLSLNGETKTTTLRDIDGENSIETLDVFIFRETQAEDNGILDTYKRFRKEELLDMSDLPIATTTGNKCIYVIANSHITNYSTIYNIEQYKKIESLLSSEHFNSYTMTGSVRTTLGISTHIDITLQRLISCVIIDNIKTAFQGTPYDGCTLTNVKVYLTNIIGNKLVHSGTTPQSVIMLNNGKNYEEDVSSCIQPGLFSDDVSSDIGDGGYNTKHYLYCYENLISKETENEKFTKAVIQGDLCGITYYYPININQIDYGYSETNGHFGIRRNTIYTIAVTIFRPGSTNPNNPISIGSSDCNVTIDDWNSTVESNIIF